MKTIPYVQKFEKQLQKILTSKLENEEKISQTAVLLVNHQAQLQYIMQNGFVGLAIQNQQLFQQNQNMEKQIKNLQNELDKTSQLLHQRLEQERLLEERRQRWKNRTRLPKREPITKEIYDFLISETKALNYSNSFRGSRLRLALALLTVTGIRISELLPVKMGQIRTLFQQGWIAINRKKRGPASHKAFLTKEGIQIMKDRFSDFEFLAYSKNDESYIFTPENSEKPLGTEPFNRIINQFIKQSSQKLDGKPRLRSHSFRIGFITQLWKDTNDIEFVRQAIGHTKIDTTSKYVEIMPDQERKQRMQAIPFNLKKKKKK